MAPVQTGVGIPLPLGVGHQCCEKLVVLSNDGTDSSGSLGGSILRRLPVARC